MRRSLRAHVGLALVLAVVATRPDAPVAARQSHTSLMPPLERTIDRHVTVRVPFGSCDIPDTVGIVAKLAELPAGLEHLPGECVRAQDDKDPGNDVPLLGMTVHEAVETIAKLDARYMVLESKGTLLVRPVAAWADKDHFLHQEIGPFAVTDENLYEAALRLHDVIRKPKYPSQLVQQPRSAAGLKPFTLDAGATSIYGAINAIVEAHGALQWNLWFCAPTHDVHAATLTFSTYDGDSRPLVTPTSYVTPQKTHPCRGIR
jgi:hypothetical protein